METLRCAYFTNVFNKKKSDKKTHYAHKLRCKDVKKDAIPNTTR